MKTALLVANAILILITPFSAVAQKAKAGSKIEVKTKTTAAAKAPTVNSDVPVLPVTSPEKMPEFPGGHAGIERYFVNALAGTPLISSSGVTLEVVIDKTGKVTQAKVKQGYRSLENGLWLDYPEVDREIVKSALKMPLWEPGINQGNPVAVRQDIHFTLMTPEQAKAEDNKVFVSVNQNPEFPGGEAKLMEYLSGSFKYPEDAKLSKTDGTVFVQFVVSRYGEVKDPTILKGLSESINAETLRVVREMPQWKPGKQNGVPVNVRYILPVRVKP